MKPLHLRLVCAMLSAAGAAGLVAFADPANAFGSATPRHCVILAADTAPASTTHHG